MRSILKTRRARFEALEDRQMLAGGGGGGFVPVPMPTVTFTNKVVPVLDILPGASGQLLADFTLKANGRANGKDYARPEEVLVIPAWASEQLSWNTTYLTLRADLDGKAKNGCEAIIATASASYETDVVDFMVYKPVWIRASQAVHFQITASFNTWLSGEPGDAQIGVEVAQVLFRDLRNNPVPDDNVTYKGVDPVLHNLENKTFVVYQDQMLETDTALVGQKGVDLLEFNSWWSDGVAPGTVTFVANQGNLANVVNYTLLADYNWDGVFDAESSGVFKSSKELVFALPNPGEQYTGARYEVRGDIVDVLSADPRIQLAFTKDGSGITAKDTDTGKNLRGVRLNGNGAGQVQVWSNPSYATLYNLAQQPALVSASKDSTSPLDQIAVMGQSVILLKTKITSTFADANMAGIYFRVEPATGDVPAFTNFKLLADGVDITSLVSISVDGADISVEFSSAFVVQANTFKVFALKAEIASSDPCSFKVMVSGLSVWGKANFALPINVVSNTITVV